MTVAAFHHLVSGRRGLAGHRALLIDLEASLLVHQRAGAERQRREALVAHAAVSRRARAALAHALVLLPLQRLGLHLCRKPGQTGKRSLLWNIASLR